MKPITALAVVLVVLTAMPAGAAELQLEEQQRLEASVETQPQPEEVPEAEAVEPAPLGTSAMDRDLRAAGYRNGRLADAALERVDSGTAEPCLVEVEAAAAWELLVLAARHDGVTGFAAGWCYRDLAQQERTFERNCPWVTDPVPPVEEGEEPPPPPEPRRVCKVPTAQPGSSNHGWGRAIDVVDTTTRKAHILSCRDPQFVWLRDNGARFGWVLPAWARCGSRSQEPWHFEWAGLTVPITELIIIERAARGAEIPH